MVYNGIMVKPGISRERAALAATLLAQLGKSPQLTKLVILLLVWGQIRLWPAEAVADETGPRAPVPDRRRIPKGKGYAVKRPRSRFL